MKISGCLLFVSTSCWILALAQSQSCPANVFGPNCKFLCHCNGGHCQNPYAICSQGDICTHGYFGPGCSYRDNLEAVGYLHSFPNEMRDDDDNTCLSTGTQFVTIGFQEKVWFTWMRVVTRPVAASIVQAIEVSFGSGIPCDNKKVYLSGNTADITCDVSTSYMSMKVAGAVAEQLCTIYVSRGRNIAIGQATNQTDTYKPEYTSDKAVDGNEDSVLENGSCTHTRTYSNSLWSVYFDYPSAIHKVVMWNRSNNQFRLIDTIITTYNVLNTLVQQIAGPNMSVASYEIDFDKGKDINTYVKWLSILQPSNQLTICELLVYGDFMCPDGTWGLDCSKTCTCSMGESCFPVTGQCSSGCAMGKYGFKCSSSCPNNCLNNTCKNRHGDCYSCKRGYFKARCETECTIGKYGFDCNETCSAHCHQFCDRISGECLGGCKNGFYGNFCQFPCPSNCDNDTCDVSKGSCAACKPGSYDTYCNKTCSTECLPNTCNFTSGFCDGCENGFYGNFCQFPCPSNCDNDTCDMSTGSCAVCKPGSYDTYCNKTCSKECLSKTCNFTSGFCDGCKNGFYGNMCQFPCPSNCDNDTCDMSTGSCAACKPGSYDTYCNKTCSTECLSKTCNFTSGFCDVCKNGFYDAKCETPCPNKDKCKDNKCDSVSGSCTSCSDKYHGEKCDLQCPADCSTEQCDRKNGSCFSCREGHYSPKCDSTCPSICMEHRCQFVTGECTKGEVSDDQYQYWLYLLLFLPIIALVMCCLWSRARKKPNPEHE